MLLHQIQFTEIDRSEIEKHSFGSVVHVHKDKEVYGDVRHPERHLKWFLINVEALSHKSGVDKLKSLLSRKDCRHSLILDESTTNKNRLQNEHETFVN